MSQATAPIDEAKLNAFMGQIVADMGAGINAALVLIGDKLGLYRGLAELGPSTPGELAAKTGTDERHVREWLCAQAAGNYVDYDAVTGRFILQPEQAMALADEDSPVFVAGGFQVIASVIKDEPKITESFRSGKGLGWHEHCSDLFVGTERFFRPSYNAHLVTEWIPALTGVEAKLRAGARVADVGCGHGASTILMAKSYPNSHFIGFDYHPESIESASKRAKDAGVGDRVKFEVAMSKNFPGKDYDLVTFFDCLHDMGDPTGASTHVLQRLAPDGTWMIVEPFAGDSVEDNLHPIGRIFYGASALICTPASKAQEVGLALGAQAGEARLRDVVTKGGFTHFRRATETPFNLVFEAKA